MELVHKIEAITMGWYKNVPHLPEGARKWIAENVWWIVLIAVILGVFGIFSAFALIGTLSVLTAGSAAVNPYYGTFTHANVGMALTAAWVAIIGMAAGVAISAMAIAPLKEQKKKGWDLLFVSDIAYFAIAIVGAIISLDFMGIAGPIVGTLISFYFLFEIRSHFLGAKTKTAATPKTAGKTDSKDKEKK